MSDAWSYAIWLHLRSRSWSRVIESHSRGVDRQSCTGLNYYLKVNLPLNHKVQKFSSGTGSPGWSRKKDRKTVVCVCVCFFKSYCPDTKTHKVPQTPHLTDCSTWTTEVVGNEEHEFGKLAIGWRTITFGTIRGTGSGVHPPRSDASPSIRVFFQNF